MEVLFRVLLNRVETLMSQYDSIIIQTFTHLQCSIGKVINKCRRNYICFFADNINAVLFALVHGKEKV